MMGIFQKRKKIGLFLIIFMFLFLPRLSKAEEKTEIDQSEPILHIQDMDISTLIKALAIKNKVNIVSTPEVTGRISLHLSNADLEDTLTAITKSSGLSWTKEGAVYIVSKGQKGKKKVKLFHINYADLKELSKVIQWSFEKVRITIYSHERILLVEGESEELPQVERLISSLDTPPKQTLIEARILEINLNDDISYGLDWGNTFSHGQVNSPGPQFPPDPSPSDTSQFFFGLAKPSYYVKLSALEKKGDVKTLATPRLMVLDGKSAQIIIGGRLGYYLTTTTETSTMQSVEFLDIGTQLKLTPQITEDGNIILNIHPEVSDGALSGGLPQKTTTAVTTSIMVKTGETIFIGGLIRNTEIQSKDRIPVLGYIPLLGNFLFSKTSTQTQRKELVILLTPHLVSAGQIISQGEIGRGEKMKDEIEKWQGEIDEMQKSRQNLP